MDRITVFFLICVFSNFSFAGEGRSIEFNEPELVNSVTNNGQSAQLSNKLAVAWFDFHINSRIRYHKIVHFRSEKAKDLFTEGYNISLRYNFLVEKTDLLRDEFVEEANESKKWALAQDIIDSEQKLYDLMKKRDKLYAEARKIENKIWEKASASEITDFIAKIESEEANHSRVKARENIAEADIYNKSVPKKTPATKPKSTTKREEFSAEVDPVKPAVKPQVKAVPETWADSETVYFRVQIAAVTSGTPKQLNQRFRNLSGIGKIENIRDNRGYTLYMIGKETNYDRAVIIKKQVRAKGIGDAFIVAFRNGKKIPLKEALRR